MLLRDTCTLYIEFYGRFLGAKSNYNRGHSKRRPLKKGGGWVV